MAKFKVLRGKHNTLDKIFRVGDVVENSTDLVAIHGKEKFEQVADSTPETGSARIQNPVAAAKEGFENQSGKVVLSFCPELDQMSFDDLKKVARTENIDFPKGSSKEALAAFIKTTLSYFKEN